MAAKKKTKTKVKFGAKAEFVRSISRDMPAKEVVAQAKKKGLVLSENYVYTIRSSGSASKKPAGANPGSKPGRRGRKPTGGMSGMSAAEAMLRDAIADLGLVSATRILESVKATIRGR